MRAGLGSCFLLLVVVVVVVVVVVGGGLNGDETNRCRTAFA